MATDCDEARRVLKSAEQAAQANEFDKANALRGIAGVWVQLTFNGSEKK